MSSAPTIHEKVAQFAGHAIPNSYLLLADAAALVMVPLGAFAVRVNDFGWIGENLRIALLYVAVTPPLELGALLER